MRLRDVPDGTPGYWLVRDCDMARYSISEHINEPALNRVCNQVLSDKTGWGYWVDRCLGRDIKGNVAWANWDWTDKFLDNA